MAHQWGVPYGRRPPKAFEGFPAASQHTPRPRLICDRLEPAEAIGHVLHGGRVPILLRLRLGDGDRSAKRTVKEHAVLILLLGTEFGVICDATRAARSRGGVREWRGQWRRGEGELEMGVASRRRRAEWGGERRGKCVFRAGCSQIAISSNQGSRVTGLRPRICHGAFRNGVEFQPASFIHFSYPSRYSRSISSRRGCRTDAAPRLLTAPCPLIPSLYALASRAHGSRSVLSPLSAGGCGRCGVAFHPGCGAFDFGFDFLLRGGLCTGRLIISLSSATSASSLPSPPPAAASPATGCGGAAGGGDTGGGAAGGAGGAAGAAATASASAITAPQPSEDQARGGCVAPLCRCRLGQNKLVGFSRFCQQVSDSLVSSFGRLGGWGTGAESASERARRARASSEEGERQCTEVARPGRASPRRVLERVSSAMILTAQPAHPRC